MKALVYWPKMDLGQSQGSSTLGDNTSPTSNTSVIKKTRKYLRYSELCSSSANHNKA